jgi:hypothetical protein
MIHFWIHEIARQRQQGPLADAEQYRLARIVRDRNAYRWTGSYKKAFPARLRRVTGIPGRKEV